MIGIAEFNSAIGGVKNYTEITGHNCGFVILITLTPDLAYHSAGGVKAEYHCSYLSIESQICNSPGNKKGSTANATSLNCIFLKYRINQSGHHSVNRCWRKVYPLGSMPRDCSSLRIIRLIQAAKDSSPSCCWACSIISRSSGSRRNWNGGLPRLSFLCVDTSITPIVMCLCVITHYIQLSKKAMPHGALTLTGHLTTNDRTSIEVAMKNHITPVTGRDSFTPNIKFLWRFFSCQQSRYLTVEARSEQEARSMLPDAPCLFSARIRQGVNHA